MSHLTWNMTVEGLKGHFKMDEKNASLHRLGSDYHEKSENGMALRFNIEGKK